MALLTALSQLARRCMATKNRVVISGNVDEDAFIYKGSRHPVLIRILELREWCKANAKQGWHTYELNPGGGTNKYFIVFEFESEKDEMLFRLYAG